MKKIKLPKTSENFIDLFEITNENLIIIRSEGNIMGFLVFNDDEWGFQYESDYQASAHWSYKLIDTINGILEDYPNCEFLVC